MRGYFNPRSPHGERPTEEMTDPDGESYISIHAPRTGSDPSMWTKTATSENFNPRSPHGERRWSLSGVRGRSDFNPRSPHGERQHATCPLLSSLLISIHAPRTGSDGNEKQTPHPEKISIHAPRTGSDATRIPVDTHSIISIHAPRTGSDDYSTSHKSGHPFTAGV